MRYFDAEQGTALRTAFDAFVADWPDVSTRTMFGCPSYQADGTLFAVLVTDGVVLTRVPDDRRDGLVAEFDTGPFDASGRTVTKWIQVQVPDIDDLEALRPYVTASYEAALAE